MSECSSDDDTDNEILQVDYKNLNMQATAKLDLKLFQKASIESKKQFKLDINQKNIGAHDYNVFGLKHVKIKVLSKTCEEAAPGARESDTDESSDFEGF